MDVLIDRHLDELVDEVKDECDLNSHIDDYLDDMVLAYTPIIFLFGERKGKG